MRTSVVSFVSSASGKVSGCIKPTPVFHLPVIAGIAQVDLRWKTPALTLARKATKLDKNYLHGTTINEDGTAINEDSSPFGDTIARRTKCSVPSLMTDTHASMTASRRA